MARVVPVPEGLEIGVLSGELGVCELFTWIARVVMSTWLSPCRGFARGTGSVRDVRRD